MEARIVWEARCRVFRKDSLEFYATERIKQGHRLNAMLRDKSIANLQNVGAKRSSSGREILKFSKRPKKYTLVN